VRKLLRTAIKFLASSKLAAILIFGLAAVSTAGIAVSAEIFSSPVFLGLAVVFLLNLTFCTAKQTIFLIGNYLKNKDAPTLKQKLKLTIIPGEETGVRKKSFLNRAGTVIFHLGILAITTGSLLFAVFGFTGKFGLFEGELFNELQQGYTFTQKGFLAGDYRKDLGVFLHSLEPVEITERKPYMQADVSVLENGLEKYRGQLEEGESKELKENSITFYNFGYFIELILKPPEKPETVERIGLDTHEHAGYQQYVAGAGIENNLYSLQVEFLPDLVSYERPLRTRSYQLKNPSLYMLARKKSEERKTSDVVFEGIIKLGQTAEFKDGFMVTFSGYRPWAAFLITKYNGIYAIYTGFILTAAGLGLRYMIAVTETNGAKGSGL